MKTKFLIAVVALQAAWVLGTVALQEMRLHSGAVILLETVPVDPRDLLRGDYVILGYKISSLPAALFPNGLGTNQPPMGTLVFVKLEKRGVFHEAQEASLKPLTPDETHPVLRGKIADRWLSSRGLATNFTGGLVTNYIVPVQYGLERYYVAEGTGNPRGKLTVEAAVPTSGNAAIRQVYIDGKPYAEAMKAQAR